MDEMERNEERPIENLVFQDTRRGEARLRTAESPSVERSYRFDLDRCVVHVIAVKLTNNYKIWMRARPTKRQRNY